MQAAPLERARAFYIKFLVFYIIHPLLKRDDDSIPISVFKKCLYFSWFGYFATTVIRATSVLRAEKVNRFSFGNLLELGSFHSPEGPR